MNFYIQGNGGEGKRICSIALARHLVHANVDTPDREIFFEVGASNATFEGYDGQPVIIWNDCRAPALIKKLGDIDNVYNTLDTFPPDMRQNVKGSSVVLRNTFNIINCFIPWYQFLDELAGDYIDSKGKRHQAEDKNQARRRIPFIFCLYQKDFDIYMNKGYFCGTREYEQWYLYRGIQGSFRELVSKVGDSALINENNAKLLDVVTSNVDRIKSRFLDKNSLPVEETESLLKNYGEQYPSVPIDSIVQRFTYFVTTYDNKDDGDKELSMKKKWEKFNALHCYEFTDEVVENIIKQVRAKRYLLANNSLPNKVIPVQPNSTIPTPIEKKTGSSTHEIATQDDFIEYFLIRGGDVYEAFNDVSAYYNGRFEGDPSEIIAAMKNEKQKN